jgi:hypothetical protein
MDGLAALVAGIPTLPGTAYIGMGMEQNRMAYLGHMAEQEGYATIFLQSSKRASFHVDSIAAMAGFKTYLGAEDIPATGHAENITERGAWDYDMLHEANRQFAAAKRPPRIRRSSRRASSGPSSRRTRSSIAISIRCCMPTGRSGGLSRRRSRPVTTTTPFSFSPPTT